MQAQTLDSLTRALREQVKKRGPLRLLAPRIRNRKGFTPKSANGPSVTATIKCGLMVNSSTDQPVRLDRFREHDVEVVVGQIKSTRDKALEALVTETLGHGQGTLFAVDESGGETVHATSNACGVCGRSFAPLDPKDFSYNSPRGWCPTCRGFGETFDMPEVDRGEAQEAVEETWFEWLEDQREICPDCDGSRLNPLARSVRLPLALPARVQFDAEPTIDAFAQATVSAADELFARLKWSGREGDRARHPAGDCLAPEFSERGWLGLPAAWPLGDNAQRRRSPAYSPGCAVGIKPERCVVCAG